MLILTATQKCALSIKVVDAKGNKAKVDGVPTWSPSDAFVDVVPSADGMSAVVSAIGDDHDEGTSSQVSVTVDANLGEGVETIVGLLDVTVIASTATVVEITAGVPEENA